MANIIRRNVGERMPSIRREFSPFRMMEDLLNWDPFRTMAPLIGPAQEPLETGFVPSFEVKESKDGYHFKADLPGVKESDLDISLSGNTLTITGKREWEEKQEGETYYTLERSYGSFARSFTLPEGADIDNARADLRDGVLAVMVPKKPEVQPRKIQVKAQGGGVTPTMGKEKPKA